MTNNQLTVNQRARIEMDALFAPKNGQPSYWMQQLQAKMKENSGAFVSSLTELYSEDSQLAQCKASDVLKQAIVAASVGLPINKSIGHSYITVFKNHGVPTPTIMISARGFIQLAQRSGMYKIINADTVYEGQLVSEDMLSGGITLDREAKKSDKVIGFFAHIETVTGFKKTLYMTTEQICHHAKIYSNAIKFDKSLTEEALYNLIQKVAKEGPIAGVVGWKGNPIAMAHKTVLKQVIYKYGPMSVEVAKAVSEDEDGWDNPMSQRDEANNAEKEEIDLDATGDAEEVVVTEGDTSGTKAEEPEDDFPG